MDRVIDVFEILSDVVFMLDVADVESFLVNKTGMKRENASALGLMSAKMERKLDKKAVKSNNSVQILLRLQKRHELVNSIKANDNLYPKRDIRVHLCAAKKTLDELDRYYKTK